MKVFKTKVGQSYAFYRITIPIKLVNLMGISPEKMYDWRISQTGNLELIEVK